MSTIISETQKPRREYYSVVNWERDLDPWHADAFPDGLKHAGTTGERKAGWMVLIGLVIRLYLLLMGTRKNVA